MHTVINESGDFFVCLDPFFFFDIMGEMGCLAFVIPEGFYRESIFIKGGDSRLKHSGMTFYEGVYLN